MKRGRSRVEADIARHHLFRGQRIECARISDLVEMPALGQKIEKIGLVSHRNLIRMCHASSSAFFCV